MNLNYLYAVDVLNANVISLLRDANKLVSD